ncbi:hypothetical protein HYV10_01650 [Candidatus Dependentiae bacterium]|nr:hypothetical protein [Candidatus Dependentiae bacterium]
MFFSLGASEDSLSNSTPRSFNTPPNQDFFDNGILGVGFARKSQDSINREKILERIRIEHDVVTQQDEENNSYLEKILCGIKDLFVYMFFSEHAQDRINESFFCNPVIKDLIVNSDDAKKAFGGQVKFRSQMHGLREWLRVLHKTDTNETILLKIQNNDHLSGMQKYFSQGNLSLVVHYTDNHVVIINYYQQSDCLEYRIQKGVKSIT